MTQAPLTTRDALAKALEGHAYTYPDSFCECGAFVDHATWRDHYADALLASGALTDASQFVADELREAAEEYSGVYRRASAIGMREVYDFLYARAAALSAPSERGGA